MEWVGLDATAVCVGLLIVGLTAVWAYVMLGGSKQPDLSALYKKDPSSSGGKKAGKGGKAKSKQGEGSPKPIPQEKRTAKQTETALKKQQLSSTSAMKEVGGATSEESPTSPPEPPSPRTKSKVKSKKAKGGSGPEETERSPPPQDESAGEWQTQLSRHQLRVLKQKQKQEREQEKEGKPPTQPPTEEEAAIAEQRGTLTTLSEKEESGKSPSALPERSDGRSELPEVGGSVSDVEKALKDATRSSSSSPDSQPSVSRPEKVLEEGEMGKAELQSSDQEGWVVL